MYNEKTMFCLRRAGKRTLMLDIAICNESIPELQQLTTLMTKYSQDRPGIPMRIRRFQSLFDLIDSISIGCTFQVCLLDHQGGQPWMNGLSAEAALRQAAPELSIIGFTGDAHSAFLCPAPDDPLGLEARLVKPASASDLYNVLDRLACRRIPQSLVPSLELPTHQGQRSLPFPRLIRAHYRSHVVSCYMDSGEVVQSNVLRVPFNQVVQPLLQSGGFCWVSASCVVNLAFIDRLDEEPCTLRTSDGEIIPVPRAAFPALKEGFEKYRGPSKN